VPPKHADDTPVQTFSHRSIPASIHRVPSTDATLSIRPHSNRRSPTVSVDQAVAPISSSEEIATVPSQTSDDLASNTIVESDPSAHSQEQSEPEQSTGASLEAAPSTTEPVGQASSNQHIQAELAATDNAQQLEPSSTDGERHLDEAALDAQLNSETTTADGAQQTNTANETHATSAEQSEMASDPTPQSITNLTAEPDAAPVLPFVASADKVESAPSAHLVPATQAEQANKELPSDEN
jgi:hypothetical protein